ncbi:MAG: NnrU family protein [Emcibacteraceae bacterium]|nr:NnrU family protein [Emcibacteraceae bacterium]
MGLLIAGIVLWSGVHFVPGLAPNLRTSLIAKMGNGYKGTFALLIVLSIVLIVMGWKSADYEILYDRPDDAVQVAGFLMLISIFLLGAANGPSNIKRYLRHPMLAGVVVWGAAHLVANGDSRSMVLFGGMVIWALLEMIIINKREGAYDRPESVPYKKDAIKMVIAVVVYTVLVFLHPYFTGMPITGAM